MLAAGTSVTRGARLFGYSRVTVLNLNMKLRHCLLSDTESETYMAQYTISYDVINKRKKLSNLTLL